MVLGQVQTEEKSNEITAIPALLDLIDGKSALVTIDAAGTQVAIAQRIVDNGGDYLLAVKANQPTLHESMVNHFEGIGRMYNKFDQAETHDPLTVARRFGASPSDMLSRRSPAPSDGPSSRR